MSARRDRLPEHSLPSMIPGVIQVCGLVEEPLTLDLGALRRLPQAIIVDDFTCLEGWSVPALTWRGPALATVVNLTRPRPEAAYATVAAGNFATSIALTEVQDGTGLLALELGGEPLPAAHGGPCRLILPGRECFTSIKWVDRIELTSLPVSTGEEIARARLSAPPH